MLKLVSVIIPIYNAEKYIGRCLDSLLIQDYENIEIIKKNDGATNNNEDHVKHYGIGDSRIKYLFKNNTGVSGARNLALENARGDYITFVDADDYVERDYISTMLEAITESNSQICACLRIDHYDSGLQSDSFFQDSGIKEVIMIDDFSFFNDIYPMRVTGVFFSKDVLEGLRFDRNLFIGEDTVFLATALHKTDKLILLHRNLYHYIIYDETSAHGLHNKRKLTEYISWQRVIRLFKDVPNVYISCRAKYADRCLKLIRKYWFNMGVSKTLYKRMVKEYRKNFKYIIRYYLKKPTPKYIVTGMAYIVFAIFPRLYPTYYFIRYKVKA